MLSDPFKTIPFSNPQQAALCLEEVLADSSSATTTHLATALNDNAAPMKALVGLQRFREHCPETVWGKALATPTLLHMLTTIFSQSPMLTDILCRSPHYAELLWEQGHLERALSKEELIEDLHKNFTDPDSDVSPTENFASCCHTLRLFRQKAILRIGIREIVHYAPIPSIAADLANLADACLELALEAAQKELTTRFGAPMTDDKTTPSTFVIMAMGKLGGRELNFSSDVDLLFFYSHDGNTLGGSSGTITNHEFFRKVGEYVIKAMSEPSPDGFIFRVDMRLRPYGRTGALAVPMPGAVEYYAEFGRAWERQALIKARPCAGDIALGELFIKRMRPFVFPKYFDDAILEDIRRTKAQTEAMIAKRGETEREVKLGRGGIRDIEFTVQMLQLLNGGRLPKLRTKNTLRALEQLEKQAKLTPFEANALARHYVFLRQIEHRIQIEDGRQCHALPESTEQLDELSRRLGYTDHEAFMRVYRERARETRNILERFLAVKGAGQLWITALLDPQSQEDIGVQKLAEMGFTAPEQARQELLSLANGPEIRPFSRSVRDQFVAITPFLLNEISNFRYPDALLLRFARILGKLSAPTVLYELLHHNPVLTHFLVTLTANSEYLCSLLMREPALLDTLSSVQNLDRVSTRHSLEDELHNLQHAYDPDAALYRLKDGEMLRIAMRELVRNRSVAEVGDELTLLAEVILREALRQGQEKVVQRYGDTDVPFAILGLGKLGGWEMGYGSDLDLIFVYDGDIKMPPQLSPVEYFAAVASQTLRILKEPTRYGRLYDIDARLRPDGNKGMLAISHHRLQQYYHEEAQPWERFALMKARAVAGDRTFALRMEQIAKKTAFSCPTDRSALEHNESLRRQMAQKAGPLDLKTYDGGIAEIEFIVRYLQLQHVAELPHLQRGDVFGALDILYENELVDRESYRTLRHNYGALRRILNRIRMQDGGHSTKLPGNPGDRIDLADRLSITAELLEYVDQLRQEVHTLYDATVRTLSENIK